MSVLELLNPGKQAEESRIILLLRLLEIIEKGYYPLKHKKDALGF